MGSFYLGGTHGERVEREPITGVWRRAPSGVQGHSPWSGGQGAKPPEAESFLALDMQRAEQIYTFAVFSAIHYNKIESCKIRAGTPQ